MFRPFAAFGGGPFEQHYRCYPVSFLDKIDSEDGGKIFLPPSALDRLAYLQVEYPMLFKLENRSSEKSTHCGVLEFISDEGLMYMPYWMMQNLLLQEGDLVTVRSANLPKGTFVKLQPHTKDFLDISNPRAVLEMTLRNFSCLTVGDTICLHYNNKRYYIDIVDAQPQGAISVIETDCEVDFAPPLDYVEPNREEGPAAANGNATGSAPAAPASTAASTAGAAQAPEEPQEPRFAAFAGAARRLDGKAVAPAAPPLPGPSLSAGATPSSRATGSAGESAAAPEGQSRRTAGKVVLPSTGNRLLDRQRAEQQNAGASAAPAPKPPAPAPDKPEEPPNGFKAFSGKGRSLKG